MTIANGHPDLILAPLDLAARYDDVRRLVCSHPAFRAAVAAGADPEDLRQDVLLRLLARQRGRSAWDPRRSSLSKYVWLVTWCCVSNYRRDQRRHEALVLAGQPVEDEEGHHHTPATTEGRSEPDELLELEHQLELAGQELGLSPLQIRLVTEAAAGRLRRDDARIVAIGSIVRERMKE